jgi:hypothetical protein
MPTNRLGRLEARRIDPMTASSQDNEVYKRMAELEAVKYAVGAMQPIDPAYTRNTYAEGDRVCKHLTAGFPETGINAVFRYQGSVTSDTHIRAHSDVDLLTIHTAFFSLEPPLQPLYRYAGDPTSDLTEMRRATVRILRAAFPSVTVDDTKGKAVALSGGSLKRKIDVVAANWFDTVEYNASKTDHLRGIMILDAVKQERITNKPFLHNYRLELRDQQVRGALRKAIRLLKSLKYDADNQPEISSYDIASIVYRMPDHLLAVEKGQELLLVQNCETYLRYLMENAWERGRLAVPNDMRMIFCEGGASEVGLRALHREVVGLLRDITEGLTRSFRKLEKARVHY